MIRFDDDNSLEVSPPDPMASIVDVIFVLIAFMMLMINAPMLTMDMKLPQASEESIANEQQDKTLQLTILAEENTWQIDGGSNLTDEALRRTLTDKVLNSKEPVAVVLNIDKAAPVQRMIETLSLLNEMKIEAAQVAVEQANTL